MRIILGEDDRIIAWVGLQARRPLANMSRAFVPPYTAIGLADDDGTLRGAVVLNAYSGPDIELSAFGHGCWSRQIIRAVFRSIFEKMGCQRVTMTVRASAPGHERLAKRLGFTREGVARQKFGNDDGVLLGMLRDECPWIEREQS